MPNKMLFSLLLIPTLATAATVIDSLNNSSPEGYVISAPGTYILGGNLNYDPTVPVTYTGTGPVDLAGITITSPDVVLDLNGHTINGKGAFTFGAEGYIGINISGPAPFLPNHTVTIENGTISNFGAGLISYRTSDLTLSGIHFTNNFVGAGLTQDNQPIVSNSIFKSDFRNALGILAPDSLTTRYPHDRFNFPNGGIPVELTTTDPESYNFPLGEIVHHAHTGGNGYSDGGHRHPPVVPEPNAFLVLLPFLGIMLLLSLRRLNLNLTSN